MFGLGKQHEALAKGLGRAHDRITTQGMRLRKQDELIEKLEQRIARLESCEVNDQNIYRIVEDLRARVPVGSAVSDFRFNELVGTVTRLQRRIDEGHVLAKQGTERRLPSPLDRRTATEVDRLDEMEAAITADRPLPPRPPIEMQAVTLADGDLKDRTMFVPKGQDRFLVTVPADPPYLEYQVVYKRISDSPDRARMEAAVPRP